MTSSTTRPCRSQQPTTCPYHRNGVLAVSAGHAAMLALDTNDTEAYFANMERAGEYNALQRRIDAGDETALRETRQQIEEAAAKVPTATQTIKPVSPGRAYHHRTPRTFTSDDWKTLQARANLRGIKLQYEDLKINPETKAVTVTGINYRGPRDDILAVESHVYTYGKEESKRSARKLEFDSENDTPTEHVITLPTFDEIANFLRGKRRG